MANSVVGSNYFSLKRLRAKMAPCSATTLPWKHRLPLCHLDRSEAQWRDLRFSGFSWKCFRLPTFPDPSSIKPHQVSLAFAGLEIAGNLHRASFVVALWSDPDPMASRARELNHVRGMVFARQLVA